MAHHVEKEQPNAVQSGIAAQGFDVTLTKHEVWRASEGFCRQGTQLRRLAHDAAQVTRSTLVIKSTE